MLEYLLFLVYAEVAQLVEHNLAKVRVAGSSPVFRSFFPLRRSFFSMFLEFLLCFFSFSWW